MPILPVPGACVACGNGGGGGTPPNDVESLILCDVNADGEVVGTALAVYEYDPDGNPVGPPTFVIPGTNDPYVTQGTLQACPGQVGCGAPQQFCFTSSDTVDAPGRMYDLTFSLGQGFAVTGIGKDLTFAPTNVLWGVNDADASDFVEDLEAAIQSQFPGATVNVAPGTDNRCIDGTQQFSIHIECLRLDQNPPSLVQLRYNGGRDLVLNPAYNETPPLNPPVSQGNYGFHLLARQDDPGPFPINQPAGRVDCTGTVNRGWETNDTGRTFEIWGQDVSSAQAVTPTPRGTPVQEVSSDGPPPGKRSTIWQTFTVTSAGQFNIRLVHGARDVGEEHIISLTTGDTDDNQVGDIILNTTNPPSVTNNGGNSPQPWTTFNQVVNLAPGTYTLAFSSTNPVFFNRGGLFTDMRAFVDGPEVTDSFVNDDATCTVPVTSENTTCEFWAPRCINGTITAWYNVTDGEELSNAAFWAQVPAPICCTASSEGGGDAALGNLIHTYLVCGQTDTGPRTLSRVVISDQNGAPISEQFVDTNGALVTPSSWQPGACTAGINVERTLGPVCYNTVPPGPTSSNGFLARDASNNTVLYGPTGDVVPFGTYTIVICPENAIQSHILCDFGNLDFGPNGDQPHQFLQWYTGSTVDGQNGDLFELELDGETEYVPVGPVGLCPVSVDLFDYEQQVLCDDNGAFLRTWAYDSDTPGIPVAVDTELDGVTPYITVGTVVNCAASTVTTDVEAFVLCDNNGPFIRELLYDGETGAFISEANRTLAGAPYVTVGAVAVCPTTVTLAENDVETQVLCDVNAGVPTSFLRRYIYDAETPGAPTVVNTLLDGVTAYAPTGTVTVCGSNVTETPVAIRSQHFNAVPGTPWTPALATGTILSVSYSVLTGTATVSDHNGTSVTAIPAGFSATWSVDEDQNTLTAPQSIASVGGRVLVVWTERN